VHIFWNCAFFPQKYAWKTQNADEKLSLLPSQTNFLDIESLLFLNKESLKCLYWWILFFNVMKCVCFSIVSQNQQYGNLTRMIWLAHKSKSIILSIFYIHIVFLFPPDTRCWIRSWTKLRLKWKNRRDVSSSTRARWSRPSNASPRTCTHCSSSCPGSWEIIPISPGACPVL